VCAINIEGIMANRLGSRLIGFFTNQNTWLGCSALLLTFGLSLLTYQSSLGWMGAVEVNKVAIVVGCILLALALVSGLFGALRLFGTESPCDSNKYTWALVGISYVLFLDAVITMVALVGFAYSEKLHLVLSSESDVKLLEGLDPEKHAELLGARLILAMAMAVLGAMFFVANRLRKAHAEGKEFSQGKFWGGIWFRLGQAVLYTAGLYLLIEINVIEIAESYVVPLALFVGMFVKSAERLFYGISQRLFAMVEVMIPDTKNKGKQEP